MNRFMFRYISLVKIFTNLLKPTQIYNFCRNHNFLGTNVWLPHLKKKYAWKFATRSCEFNVFDHFCTAVLKKSHRKRKRGTYIFLTITNYTTQSTKKTLRMSKPTRTE